MPFGNIASVNAAKSTGSDSKQVTSFFISILTIIVEIFK